MASGIMIVCEKENREIDSDNFYTRKDGSKLKLCKKCFTMHMNAFDPETFVWGIKEMDLPYIPEEWNKLRDSDYAKKGPKKFSTGAVFGKYISKMKLNQYKHLSWADTDRLQQEAEARKQKMLEADPGMATRDAELKEALEKGEITEAEYKTFVNTEVLAAEPQEEIDPIKGFGGFNYFDEKEFAQVEMPDPSGDLTEDDKLYLAMKWGSTYRPAEWIALETDYAKMDESFDIQDADTENVLILLCKTNLKANQAIDCGDIDGYQKLARVQESLRKSAKFTKAQKKEEEANFVDCVGQLVSYCEKEGHRIPRYEITAPLDIVDKVINDLKEYNKSLIYEDAALARQIEEYLKNRENAEKKKRDEEEAKAKGLEYVEVNDEDHIEHMEMLEKERAEDELLYGEEEE